MHSHYEDFTPVHETVSPEKIRRYDRKRRVRLSIKVAAFWIGCYAIGVIILTAALLYLSK